VNKDYVLKTRWIWVAGLALAAALLAVVPVSAAETSGDDGVVVIGADEVIEDDFVFGGESLTVDGVIQGDLLAGANTIVVNGTVEGDLMAGAMSITVNGEVQEDMYVGAYAVEIGEDAVIGDELMLGAYSLETGEGSSVGGDILFGAGQALLAGDVSGAVRGGGGGVQIDGSVGGDVEVGVAARGEEPPFDFSRFIEDAPPVPSVPYGLTLGDDASIGGDLTVTSTEEFDVPSGVAAGETEFRLEVPDEEEQPDFGPTRPGAAVGFFAGQFVLKLVRRFITLTLVGLLIIWLAAERLTDTVETFKARPWASLGTGAIGYAVAIVALFILPALLILVAILLGIISLGGLTPAVLGFGSLGWGGLLVGFITAISWLAKIVLGMWLGQIIWQGIKPEGKSLIPPLLIGAALAAVLTAIPILGGVVGFAVALFGLGALILTVRGQAAPPTEEPAVAAA